jgi:hypothetical protein
MSGAIGNKITARARSFSQTIATSAVQFIDRNRVRVNRLTDAISALI